MGVSSNEQSLSTVGGSHVGCSYNAPFSIEPRFGKVREDRVETEREVSPDVLQDDETWAKVSNSTKYPGPQVSGVIGSSLASGLRERLAGVARGEHVGPFNRRPVDGLDVPEVRHVGETVGQHGAGVAVGVRHGSEVDPAEQLGQGELQPAVARAQGQDAGHATAWHCHSIGVASSTSKMSRRSSEIPSGTVYTFGPWVRSAVCSGHSSSVVWRV